MDIIPIPALRDNYIWTMIKPEDHTAWVIDPGDAAPVIDFLKQQKLTLKAILITHHHWDHTAGVAELREQQPTPVYGSAKEKIADVTHLLKDEEDIHMEGCPLTFHVIAIPGHTLDHIAYYSPGLLFCGDTLFAAGCGRVFEGTPEQMYASLQKIAALPDDTRIYCAHEYTLNNLHFAEIVEPENTLIKQRITQVSELRNKNLPSLPSTLSEEKETNPFLRCDSPELIAQVETYANQTLHNPIEVFTWVRKWKDSFIIHQR